MPEFPANTRVNPKIGMTGLTSGAGPVAAAAGCDKAEGLQRSQEHDHYVADRSLRQRLQVPGQAICGRKKARREGRAFQVTLC